MPRFNGGTDFFEPEHCQYVVVHVERRAVFPSAYALVFKDNLNLSRIEAEGLKHSHFLRSEKILYVARIYTAIPVVNADHLITDVECWSVADVLRDEASLVRARLRGSDRAMHIKNRVSAIAKV